MPVNVLTQGLTPLRMLQVIDALCHNDHSQQQQHTSSTSQQIGHAQHFFHTSSGGDATNHHDQELQQQQRPLVNFVLVDGRDVVMMPVYDGLQPPPADE